MVHLTHLTFEHMKCWICVEKTLLCLTYLLGPGAPGVSFCGDKGGARGGVYMWLQKWLAFLGRGMVVSKPVLQWTFPISLNHIHCLGAKYARMTFSDEAFNAIRAKVGKLRGVNLIACQQ